MSNIIKPVININGSDPEQLAVLWANMYRVGQELLTTMGKGMPHGRDYQTLPTADYIAAHDQHCLRMQKIKEVIDEIEEIAVSVREQADERVKTQR